MARVIIVHGGQNLALTILHDVRRAVVEPLILIGLVNVRLTG